MTIIATVLSTEVHDLDWLTTSIASWLHRTDLTSRIPDFIALAESEINTELRLRLMEVDEEVTLTSGERTATLPERYLEPIKLELTFSDRDNEELTYLSPKQMPSNDAAGAAGEPQHWTVSGDSLEFPFLADRDYTLNFRMVQGVDIASTLTNPLLSKYPGIYLYGALKQGALYCADSRVDAWGATYEQLKKKANRAEGRNNRLTAIRSEHPSVHTRGSNIFRG